MSFAVNEAYVEINRKSFGFIAVNQRNAFETVAYGGCNIVEAQPRCCCRKSFPTWLLTTASTEGTCTRCFRVFP